MKNTHSEPQAATEYFSRKADERRAIADRLPSKVGLPPSGSAYSIAQNFDWKRQAAILVRQQRGAAFSFPPTWMCKSDVELHEDPSTPYRYQRFDLNCETFYKTAPFGQPELPPTKQAKTLYFNSGTSAIACVLLTLQAVFRGSVPSILARNLYFETELLLAHLGLSRVRPSASRRSVLNHEAPIVLYIDYSVERKLKEALTRMLAEIRGKKVVAIVIDSTTSLATDPLPTELISMKLPIFVVRSNTKLDQLGYEFFPAGSCTLIAETIARKRDISLIQRLFKTLIEYRRLLSAALPPDAFGTLVGLGFPYNSLSQQRQTNLRSATRYIRSTLSNSIGDRAEKVLLPLQHDCFFFVRLSTLRDPDPFIRKLNRAYRDCPIYWSSSFGFDWTTLDYFDKDLRGAMKPLLRVSPGDIPREACDHLSQTLGDSLCRED